MHLRTYDNQPSPTSLQVQRRNFLASVVLLAWMACPRQRPRVALLQTIPLFSYDFGEDRVTCMASCSSSMPYHGYGIGRG